MKVFSDEEERAWFAAAGPFTRAELESLAVKTTWYCPRCALDDGKLVTAPAALDGMPACPRCNQPMKRLPVGKS